MVIVEERIRNCKEAMQPLRNQVITECTATFMAAIGPNEFPSLGDLEQAAAAARERASMALTADQVLTAIPNGPSDPPAQEALRMSWFSLMPEWMMPPPSAETTLSAWRLALAGALGSVLGMFLIGGLMHWLLDMRDAGILLGATLGAAGLVYGAWFAAQSEAVRTALMTFVGVSTAAELFFMLSHIGFGGLWKRLIGAGGLAKRSLLYGAIIALMALTRKRYRYNPQTYEGVVHRIIEQWVDYGVLLLISLAHNTIKISERTALDPEMARALVNLHASSAADLPLVAEAVLQEARRLGLDGLDSPPRFVDQRPGEKQVLRWEKELEQQFKRFGVIEPGDTVVIEEEPVVQNGVLIEPGLVRKIRH